MFFIGFAVFICSIWYSFCEWIFSFN